MVNKIKMNIELVWITTTSLDHVGLGSLTVKYIIK
jgi:hypothetical protein